MSNSETPKLLSDLLMKGTVKVVLSFVAFLVIAFFYNGFEEYGKIQMSLILTLHILVFLLFYWSNKDKVSDYAVWGLIILVIWNIILIVLMFKYMIEYKEFGSELAGVFYLTYEYYKSIKELKTAV